MNWFRISLFFLWLGIFVKTAEMAYQKQSQNSYAYNYNYNYDQYGMMPNQQQKMYYHDQKQSGYKQSESGHHKKSEKPKSNQELLDTLFLQPINVGRDRKYDDFSHNDPYLCARDCSKYPKPRLCYYKLHLEQYSTMGPACRNCSSGNMTDCKRQQCVTANGIERAFMSMNRMLPGTTIYGCEGDRFVIDVINGMPSSVITLHWHGYSQRTTPYMDGVPYVTQCPIAPNSQFRYDFPAEAGTRFYHSHVGELQRDGILAAIIAQQAAEKDPNSHLYDFDYPSHVVQVSDWNYYPGSNTWPGYYKNKTMTPIQPDSFLINGVGIYEDAVTKTNVPLAEFHVKCGYRYRLRIIANTWSTCGYYFGIEGHELLVIAVDGNPVKPFVANTLFMGSGQRTDVVLYANQECNKSYYVVVKGANLCENSTNPQIAHLIYDNADPKPASLQGLEAIYNKGPYFNFYELGCERSDVICEDELRSYEKAPKKVAQRQIDYTFKLPASSIRGTYDELFETFSYEETYLPVGNFDGALGHMYGGVRDALNNISNVLPSWPVLTQPDHPFPPGLLCDGAGNCPNGESTCRCCNVINIKLGSLVQLVFVDLVSSDIERLLHPMHLHGADFYIYKQGSAEQIANNSTGYYKNLGKSSHLARRDTVLIPPNGFTNVVFLADNPGYWLMHCHMENHMNGGMLLVFKVGEKGDWNYPDKSWPKCEPYAPAIEGLEAYCTKHMDG